MKILVTGEYEDLKKAETKVRLSKDIPELCILDKNSYILDQSNQKSVFNDSSENSICFGYYYKDLKRDKRFDGLSKADVIFEIGDVNFGGKVATVGNICDLIRKEFDVKDRRKNKTDEVSEEGRHSTSEDVSTS